MRDHDNADAVLPPLPWGLRVLRPIAVGLYRLCGWKFAGEFPGTHSFVLVAHPHTSNWDFPLMIAIGLHFRMRLHWMGKDSLFKGPMGPVMRALGGVAVDRSHATDMVGRMAEEFGRRSSFILLIPPQGSRTSKGRWKTGFYYIAQKAGVPIVLGFLDFGRKVGGFGPSMIPTGDYAADEAAIHAFYADKRALHPERLRPPGGGH